ncbi:MAG: glucoamylase family protein [Acidobacteriota bacterium]
MSSHVCRPWAGVIQVSGVFEQKRVVLAFFSAGTADEERAYRTLRSQQLRVERTAAGASSTSIYAQLMLPDESLLVASVGEGDPASIVETLQAAGARSIFLTMAAAPKAGPPDSLTLGSRGISSGAIQKSLERLRCTVQDARGYLAESLRSGHLASPAARWVIDNAYLVSLHLQELRKYLPAAFKESTLLQAEHLMRRARDLVKGSDGRITEESLLACLQGSQEDGELDSPKLWSFPLLLRASLIEYVAALARRATRVQQLREMASLWADRLTLSATRDRALLEEMAARMEQQPFATDRTFAVTLAEQLQDQETVLALVHTFAEKVHHASLPELVRGEHEREATDALQTSNAFGSLRIIGQIDYKKLFEAASRAEAILQRDPAGIYPRSSFATRDHGRQIVAHIARQSQKTESAVAQLALELATAADAAPRNGVLYYLIAEGVTELEGASGARIGTSQRVLRALRNRATVVYLSAIGLLTVSFLAIVTSVALEAGIQQPSLLVLLGILASLPLSELAIQMTHSLLINTFPPEPLPKMNFLGGAPAEAATMVVVPMMLSTVESVKNESEKLEVRYLANRESNLSFALFSDFLDASEASTPSDAPLLLAARQAIAGLNQKYPQACFLLFHRARTWSVSEQAWIGRERKRGKIQDLIALLCGHGDPQLCVEGVLLEKVAYLITLDADTRLPPGAALRLVETIAHPLNRVEIDPKTGVRARGFTIIQPRVGIALPGANATRFTRIFSDAHGTDPYCTVVSDAQQDLFLEGIFHGKAILDVRAFDQILHNRFPEETLLSHDLIEGAHVGVGFASDIDLLENLPLDYASYSRRQHRWIRGDWQIAAWATARVPDHAGKFGPNPLSTLNRWRILDNLRRSLVPVASILLVGFGWFFSVAPSVWSIVLALTVGVPAIVPILDRWTRHLEGSVYGWEGAADDLERAAVLIAFLPHQAWLALDAIVRACHRSVVSKRRLLEWQTADAADAHRISHLQSAQRDLNLIAGGSAVALFLLALKGSFAPAVAYLGVWIAAPWLMRWLGGNGPAIWSEPISREDVAFLRSLARRTWRYFDDLVGEESNWLPPDNSQLALHVEVAKRTSPTNIGLWFNAAMAAHDFGYLTSDEYVRRCTASFVTLQKLQRYEGHLLNWYDTQSLQPLQPQFVSTVDSGNLICSLWVLSRSCDEMVKTPILGPEIFSGLADTIANLETAAAGDSSLRVALLGLSNTVRGKSSGIERIGQLRLISFHSAQLKAMKRWSSQSGDEMTYWALKLATELDSWSQTIDQYLSWMELLSGPSDELLRRLEGRAVDLRRQALGFIPSLQELSEGPPETVAQLLSWRGTAELAPELADWLDRVDREYRGARERARTLLSGIAALRAESDTLAQSINMKFLYDPARRLFGTGYAVGNPLVFNSHYDLLASECRVASLVAIAKGDVPADHWFELGRPRISTPECHLLLSWSGTMFEYLMPLLFTEAFDNTLLLRACREAVDAQIAYGQQDGLPWGISEAAYSALDSNQTYQYRAFGIPALALNPNADPGPVVAPYASALALMVRPTKACANLRRLEASGLHGPMGFYEAIDYTRLRRKDEKPGVPIFAYMAHHQGMSLLAISNVLNKSVVQRRFHSDLRVRAVESLLYESVPITRVERKEAFVPSPVVETSNTYERRWSKPTQLPRVYLSSNGRYSLMISNNGGGYSRWKGFDITRWRSDSARDGWGTFLWVKDVRNGVTWSPAAYPSGDLGEGSVTFSSDRAEFVRRVLDLEAKVEVATATADDAEVRRITLNNRSLRSRSIELTSYAELALAPHAADMAHPVFSKLFVETELLENGVLIAHRRLRSPEEPMIWTASMLLGAQGPIEFETDRRKFVGRGRDASSPVALNQRLSGTVGTVIDPIFSFRHRLTLEPREQRTLCLVTLAAATREDLLAAIHKFQRPDAVERAFEMIWTRAQLEFRYLRIGPASAHRFQDLAGHLLYPNPRLRPPSARLMQNRRGQSSLWRFGISGDLPMLVVSAADAQGASLVREVLLADSYWRMLGLAIDIVILNREAQSYHAPLRKTLDLLVHSQGAKTADNPGGVFVLDWWSLPPEDQTCVLAAATVVLGGQMGTLQQQLVTPATLLEEPISWGAAAAVHPSDNGGATLAEEENDYNNGLGGFAADGREYGIELDTNTQTPVPWANVIANENFGTVVTEGGLGFTWNRNSQMNRLTPWHNDPISDPQSEVLYLRDEETGSVWTPTPLPMRGTGKYRIRHGQGYTCYEHKSNGLAQSLKVYVAASDPVKICVLQLQNESNRTRKLTATYFTEWVLGSTREQQNLHVTTSFDPSSKQLFAQQFWGETFSNSVAFLASSPKPSSFSCDRIAFLGRARAFQTPAALKRARLDGKAGAGLDPCGALQVDFELAPGASKEITFFLGQAESEAQANAIVQRLSQPSAGRQELELVSETWDRHVGAIQVQTPAPSANLLLNRWLLYQALSCRIWARSALYQSGGAIGFRDQLQDCLALIYSDPTLTRAHILRSAARQFPEGDVQHWWHAETGMGVRTLCSDDLLWLPWVVARYVEITGDMGILEESIPFLDGPPLDEHQHEKMFTPGISAEHAPLWEHCFRAIEYGSRFGTHGLPLFGSGDWNDGMNRVGIEGRGESVWLAWFLLAVLDQWGALIGSRKEGMAAKWLERANLLATAIEQSGWDGDWYLRGYFDDGTPLGSHLSAEAKIDALPQAWAAMSSHAPKGRVQAALTSAKKFLIRPEHGLALLFTPPFDHSVPHPGYIMGYPPGMRENGGQYTHGALWLAQAMARQGDGDGAVALLQMLNPIERSATPELVAKYRGEPYAVAADVSSSPGREGAADWTWYTGSAGWMYRVWMEDVLGFHLRGDMLCIQPAIPEEWNGFTMRYKLGASTWHIEVERISAGKQCQTECDGVPQIDGKIHITDDAREHRIRVLIGSAGPVSVGRLVSEFAAIDHGS